MEALDALVTMNEDEQLAGGKNEPGLFAPLKKKRRRPSGVVIVAGGWLLALTILSAFAAQFPFIRTIEQFVKVRGKLQTNYKLGPGWTAWFGTDGVGKDVFAKCIYGAKVTLTIAFTSTVVGLVVGGFLGMVSGYFKGWVDRVVSICTDILLAFPPLVLALLAIYRLDDIKAKHPAFNWFSRTWQVTVVLSILAIGPLTRIVRAQTLAISEREFVLSARSLGAKNRRILVREVLPNLIPAMVSVAFTGIAVLIVAEGGLAFLGLSVQSPPTWGRLISDNYKRVDDAWWATFFPCMMLFITVLAFNLIGDRIARKFDIREAAI